MPKRPRSPSPRQETRRTRSQPSHVHAERRRRHRTPSPDGYSSDSPSDDRVDRHHDIADRSNHGSDEGQTSSSRKHHHSSRLGSDRPGDENDRDRENEERRKKKLRSSSNESRVDGLPVVPVVPVTIIPTDVVSMPTTNVKSDRHVVLFLDTNILLEQEGLDFLEKVMKNQFDDVLPNLRIVVPHIVFLELDTQKSRRQGDIAFRARCAARFLTENLCDRHDPEGASSSCPLISRIAGQTLDEYTEAAKKHEGRIADDHFLFCCLQYQEKYAQLTTCPQPVVVSVTNDKILRCRCSVNHLNGQSLGSLLDNIERRRAGRQSLFDWPEQEAPADVGQQNKENNKE